MAKLYKLNKMHVEKIVDSKEKADNLIAKGFKQISVEEIEEKYTCEVCGKEYKTEKGLIEHIQAKHGATEKVDNGELGEADK